MKDLMKRMSLVGTWRDTGRERARMGEGVWARGRIRT